MFSNPDKNIEQFHVDPGMKVADLGSGPGFYVLALAKAVGETGKVFAVDIQQELLNKIKSDAVREKLDNIEYVWADLEEERGTLMSDHVVDRVVIANTLFQVENRKVLVREALRILKPKGRLLLVDWTDSHGGLGPTQNSIITPENAEKLITEAGFVLEKKISAGDHHYGLVFKPKE
jgi:ubiquinone/menaquinone biosynthesis C-methylase UbiE